MNPEPVNAYDKKYLSPTAMINSDHRDVIDYAMSIIKDVGDDTAEKAVKLYYAVRDGIWYDPYYPFYLPEHYRASTVLKRGRGYCVPKASLLCALGRACGIPTRLGFADVRNHLATRQLIEFFGSDLFVYHGFVEFYLEGKWVKATPAFNRELCLKHKVAPLEFNGHEDSIFHEYNEEKKQFMEYMTFHGTYDDIPLKEMLMAWEKTYGEDRIRKWISDLKKSGDKTYRNFDTEDVVKI
jgi:transglutaminase-like putative cysteine protease